MNLYLVQHAEAKAKTEDPKRPLSEKGQADIQMVAAYVAKHSNIKLGQIKHSGKTRARQTAAALAEALQPAGGISQAADLTPLAEVSAWAARLAAMTEDVMLVGHLPHLSKLAALLLCQDDTKTVVAFQMGSLVCLGRDEKGVWALRWVVRPEIAGAW